MTSSPDSFEVRIDAASAPRADRIMSTARLSRSSSEPAVTADSAAVLSSANHRATGPAPVRDACSAAAKRWSSPPGSGVSWDLK